MNYSHTVKDLSRNVAWLDANTSADADLYDTIPGEVSTVADKCNALANDIGYHLARAGIAQRTIGLESVVSILASHGMSAFGIEQFAIEIHDRIKGDFSNGGMSCISLKSYVSTLTK